jgi:hypothetical protein
MSQNDLHFAAADAREEREMSVPNLLLVVAFVLFALAAFGLPVGRINLLAAGLACWLLSQILGAGILR